MVNVVRELMFEVNDDDAEQLKTDLESAFEAKTSMLWVSDRDGRNAVSYTHLTLPTKA